MKASSLFILALLGLQACSPKPGPKTLISQWGMDQTDKSVVERKLASAPEGQCLNDIFTVDTLKAEIRELEKKYAGAERVRGGWRHLNLSELPVPQAQFLKIYGNEIGDLNNPDAIDYSQCLDVPCVFNKIYDKEEHVAGYVHYLWYLKFGHMLSADNAVPVHNKTPGIYNGKSFELSSYLYTDNELYGFWRLSLMLKAPFTTLAPMKQIQKVPRGERFEGADYKSACGLAYSTGWILLTDGCVTVDVRNLDKGYLYPALTHELSHQIDYDEGRRIYKSSYRSQENDYLDLAGIYLHEYRDEENKLQRVWKHREGIKLMTAYAGTSPQENFAESLAYFRVDGEKARTGITQDHFDFVSREYYQKRGFDQNSLFTSWIKASEIEVNRMVFNATIACSKDPGNHSSHYFQKADFNSPPMTKLLACLGANAQDVASRIKSRSMIHEPEACHSLSSYQSKNNWDSLVKRHLVQAFEKYLNELRNDEDYLARFESLQQQMSDKKTARDSYVSCFQESDEASCYENDITAKIFQLAGELNLPEDQTQEMAILYLEQNPFSQTQNETLEYYRSFILSHRSAIHAEADHLWASCKAISPDDTESPRGSLFLIRDGYMISSIYNCLNSRLPSYIQSVVREFSVNGFRVQHAKEEMILSQEVKPEIIFRLIDLYSSEREKEAKLAQNVIEKDQGKIKKELLQNFTWVKNAIDSKKIVLDCQKEGLSHISFLPLFHLKKDLFSSYLGESVCADIFRTPEFKKWIDGSQEDLNERLVSGLEDKIFQQANLQAKKCVEKYPVNSFFNRVRYKLSRDACLFDEWAEIEKRVIMEILSDPVVSRFNISRETLEENISASRQKLQEKVTREHFKGISNFSINPSYSRLKNLF